jgi:L-aminopeptidase/D-esterase-like protein
MFNAITDVEGIRVGHATDLENGTGCTVVLCPPEGAVGGVDVRGPAPGTRETDLLRPGHLVQRVNAVLLTGGSAFGLDAAGGVMRYLEEQGVGFDTGVARVPIVPAAVIFDLAVGSAKVRPSAEMGYRACLAAAGGPVQEGSVGAGTGAVVGHFSGPLFTTKGGIGTASEWISGGVVVGAIVVVNAVGDIVDPRTGEILAGTRRPDGGWLDSAQAVKSWRTLRPSWASHTTIGVIATNAALGKDEVNLVAAMAHDGIERAVRPAHVLYDGDALFALSAGRAIGDVSAVGHTAAELVARAIVRAVEAATAVGGVPARRDLVAP